MSVLSERDQGHLKLPHGLSEKVVEATDGTFHPRGSIAWVIGHALGNESVEHVAADVRPAGRMRVTGRLTVFTGIHVVDVQLSDAPTVHSHDGASGRITITVVARSALRRIVIDVERLPGGQSEYDGSRLPYDSAVALTYDGLDEPVTIAGNKRGATELLAAVRGDLAKQAAARR